MHRKISTKHRNDSQVVPKSHRNDSLVITEIPPKGFYFYVITYFHNYLHILYYVFSVRKFFYGE